MSEVRAWDRGIMINDVVLGGWIKWRQQHPGASRFSNCRVRGDGIDRSSLTVGNSARNVASALLKSAGIVADGTYSTSSSKRSSCMSRNPGGSLPASATSIKCSR